MSEPAPEEVAREICAERCAFMGEPPCWQIVPGEWPNPNCDEPGCVTLARAAIDAMKPVQDAALRSARAAALEEAARWQPIETAPKDGATILLCETGFTPITGFWDREVGKFVADNGCAYEGLTHWMPLPEPPATAIRALDRPSSPTDP